MSDRLTEIEQRLDAATPGPWTTNADGDSCSGPFVWSEGAQTTVVGDWEVRERDAPLIAHAPADLRWLIDEVRRLRGTMRRSQQMSRLWDAEGRAERAEAEVRRLQRRNADTTPGDAPDARQEPRRVAVAPGPTDSAKGAQIARNDDDATQGDA